MLVLHREENQKGQVTRREQSKTPQGSNCTATQKGRGSVFHKPGTVGCIKQRLSKHQMMDLGPKEMDLCQSSLTFLFYPFKLLKNSFSESFIGNAISCFSPRICISKTMDSYKPKAEIISSLNFLSHMLSLESKILVSFVPIPGILPSTPFLGWMVFISHG